MHPGRECVFCGKPARVPTQRSAVVGQHFLPVRKLSPDDFGGDSRLVVPVPEFQKVPFVQVSVILLWIILSIDMNRSIINRYFTPKALCRRKRSNDQCLGAAARPGYSIRALGDRKGDQHGGVGRRGERRLENRRHDGETVVSDVTAGNRVPGAQFLRQGGRHSAHVP